MLISNRKRPSLSTKKIIGRGYTAGTLMTQPIPPLLCLYSYISNFGDINKYT
jgi:hypothetical protein